MRAPRSILLPGATDRDDPLGADLAISDAPPTAAAAAGRWLRRIGIQDLAAVREREPDRAVLLTGVRDERCLDAVGASPGPGAPVWLWVASAACVARLDVICGRVPGIAGLIVDSPALGTDLRVPVTPGRLGLIAALGQCVLVARAHGLGVIDGDSDPSLADDAYRRGCEQALNLGFDGRTAVTADQVKIANTTFRRS